MSLKDLNRRHLSLIGLFSTRYAVRGGAGLIYLLLVLVAGLLVANIVITPVENIQADLKRRGESDADAQKALDDTLRMAKPYVSWALGDREKVPDAWETGDGRIKDRWATYLLEEQPALLSAVLLVLLLLLPVMSVIGSFNQYSGDVGSRGLRYQLLRTERANIYFGRYLGTILYSALTMALLIATIVTYMGFKLDYYSWPALIGWGLRGYCALVILLLPYVALCGWISGAIDSPFVSLVLCILVVAGVRVAAIVGELQWEQARLIKWLLPWGIQLDLLHYSTTRALLAALACLGYTVVFLTVGYRHFAKRDL